jgi:hypothetical protein
MRPLYLLLLLGARLLCQVTTSQYDDARTGANLTETILTPRNVNSRQFGKLFAFPVDGDVYAQPLYLPGLDIPGKGKHDVVFIATEHDSVYAFDAAGDPRTPLWKVNFTDPAKGITTVPAADVFCPFISPEIGITSTPVIDVHSRTLYVLVRTSERDTSGKVRAWQRLHALDVLTGKEQLGGPVVIRAATTPPSSALGRLFSQEVDFRALHDNPRAALLLVNGIVYLSWASSCDVPPYHGWVMAYDAHTLKQIAVFNASPGTGFSGIWQGDTGPVADERGNVYVVTGNGVFDAASGGRDYGDSILKLALTRTGLVASDYFTPHDQAELNATDGDLGSGGPILVPQPGSLRHLLIAGGKSGVLYVLDPDHMGKFHAHDDSGALSEMEVKGRIFGAPAYWNGHLYVHPDEGVLTDFAIRDRRLVPIVQSTSELARAGATPAVSANGTKDGIVWIISSREPGPGNEIAVLHAADGENVSHELYSSAQNPDRDRAGYSRRFVIPLVANGRVYVGTAQEIDVYGLLPLPTPPKPQPTRRKPRDRH